MKQPNQKSIESMKEERKKTTQTLHENERGLENNALHTTRSNAKSRQQSYALCTFPSCLRAVFG